MHPRPERPKVLSLIFPQEKPSRATSAVLSHWRRQRNQHIAQSAHRVMTGHYTMARSSALTSEAAFRHPLPASVAPRGGTGCGERFTFSAACCSAAAAAAARASSKLMWKNVTLVNWITLQGCRTETTLTWRGANGFGAQEPEGNTLAMEAPAEILCPSVFRTS